MNQPKGLEEPGKADDIRRLRKSLHCLKQAEREWHTKLSADVRKAGFNKLRTKSCVYRKKNCLNSIRRRNTHHWKSIGRGEGKDNVVKPVQHQAPWRRAILPQRTN